ncbi:MAG: tetratricopeptide repeat protein [Bryobacteraceae bacterium]|jgi:tetratricopeptide (TPR) repeat protein
MADAADYGELLRQLREDIAHRRLDSGMRCLEANRGLIGSLAPTHKSAGVLLGYLAQWVDIGFEGPQLIKRLLPRFPKNSRAALPLLDYLHLRMAEGLVAMTEENFDQAIQHFAFVESVEEEVRDREMLAISNFWIGRCLRSQGRYDDALSFTVRARELAQELGYAKMAAVMQVLESWLAFQKGKLQEAARTLQEAEAALSQTDDYVNRGNIQSAYGRIARREARYERALEYFEKAMEEYARRNPRHPNLARSLVNMASAERLMRLQLRKKMDAAAASRKASGGGPPTAATDIANARKQFGQLREKALAQLEAAGAIYQAQGNHRGMGAVHILRGFLCLDSGELDSAGSEAAQAFRLAEPKADYILMARARILQSIVENSQFDEQIEEAAGANQHAQLAHDFARDAVDFAKHTQNRRLLARAYVCQGMSFANEFFDNVEAARQCCDAAAALLKPQGPDYIWDDLQDLKARILRRGPVDTVLREWSQGLIGDKTFQQITEDFAHIIIPKVWEREERKISRVAARLSISPKKVRRVLRAAGLLDS